MPTPRKGASLDLSVRRLQVLSAPIVVNKSAITGFVLALALVAALIFAVVAVHEFNYHSAHPYGSGPSLEIAWGGVAGVLLSIAVGAIGLLVARESSESGLR